jgi:hypothetical protein
MRVVVLVKASEESEAGVMPTEADLAEMGKFNEELVNAGIMLAGEGLHPSSKGVRIQYPERKVVDGPFKSMDEAVEWMKRAPFQEGDVEIRRVFEADDFGEEFTPELREQEERHRAQMAGNQ